MIVTRSPFVLTTPELSDLKYPRVCWQTWTRDAAAADIAVSSETENGPKDAPLRPDTAEYWEAEELPATWQLDLGAIRDITYIGLAGHDLGTNRAHALFETSEDGANWSQFAAENAPADDTPLLFLDDARAAMHVRLTLTGENDAPKIAVIYIGAALVMPHTIYGGHQPITLSRETVLMNQMSRGGQFLGQHIRRMGVSTSVSFRHLDPDWVRTDFDPFVKAARQYPYFFAWRPSTRPREVGYVWTRDAIKASNMGTREFMQVAWSMEGIGSE